MEPICSRNRFREHKTCSDIVVDESSRGDQQQARKRLEQIQDFDVLEISEPVQLLAGKLIAEKAIPKTCPEDALHIACATVNRIDFILTWNFKHINNPFMIRKIERVVHDSDYEMPVICSPEEFLEAEHE